MCVDKTVPNNENLPIFSDSEAERRRRTNESVASTEEDVFEKIKERRKNSETVSKVVVRRDVLKNCRYWLTIASVSASFKPKFDYLHQDLSWNGSTSLCERIFASIGKLFL